MISSTSTKTNIRVPKSAFLRVNPLIIRLSRTGFSDPVELDDRGEETPVGRVLAGR